MYLGILRLFLAYKDCPEIRLCSLVNKQKNGVSVLRLTRLAGGLLTPTLVWYQDRVVQAVKLAINHLGSVQGYQLTRRPFQVPWCLNQLSM